MKINFKTILIIFLVALLGGAAGTYGVLSIKEATDTSASINRTTDVQPVISEVSYSNESSGAYVTAIDKALDTAVEITTDAEYTSYNFFGGYSTSNATFLGSGVIISEDGYIVTNKHVVNQAKDVSVRLQNGDSYEATIIGVDNNTDLALLKIEASGLSYAKLADSDELKLGQEVIAIGNALGNGTSCSNGIISAINREVTIKNYTMTLLLTNAERNSGNSGGGLFDMNGNLVGIVNAKTSSSAYSSNASIEGIGYAIPSNTVKNIVNELLANGYVKDRPSLGVSIYTSEYNLYHNVEGLVISEVLEGGSADKAGLQKEDIIKAIDGETVTEFSQLSRILENHQIGDRITLSIARGEETFDVVCTLQDSSVLNQ